MLSRSAEGLFWLGRYIERAENVARLLEAGRRFDQMPLDAPAEGSEWTAILVAAGCRDTFGDDLEAAGGREAIAHLVNAKENPSSIQSCFALARANARAQRVELTSEVWSSTNDAWRESRDWTEADFRQGKLSRLVDRIRAMAAEFRGAVEGTMLRSEGYDFIRLGEAVERADATARLIDVKYHVLLPEDREVGGGFDQLQWNHLLRAAGARSSYRWYYRAPVSAELVVDFLVLNRQSPRSLRYCNERITERLARLHEDAGISRTAEQIALEIRELMPPGNAKAILAGGLHEYLTDHIIRINKLALAIADDFGFGAQAASQSQTG